MKFEIGEVCEYQAKDGNWLDCTIMGIGDIIGGWHYADGTACDYSVHSSDGEDYPIAKEYLRKKKPPEQKDTDLAEDGFIKDLNKYLDKPILVTEVER